MLHLCKKFTSSQSLLFLLFAIERERALSYTVRVYFRRFLCMCTRVFPCEFIYIFLSLLFRTIFSLSLCIHIHHPLTFFFVNKKKFKLSVTFVAFECGVKMKRERKIKAKSHYVHFVKYANDGIGRRKKSAEPDLGGRRFEKEV